MEDAPRTKRRRTDAAADETAPLVRSDEFWFDDGNIILQVESTQFRVAKSVLSRQSSVFRDMFALPLPADEPTVEGCPVAVLQGDTELDWVLFLAVLYPTSYVEEAPTVGLLAAMLRLSKKYDFPVFRKDCLSRLKTQFPTTLREFDGRVSSGWTLIKFQSATSYRDLVSLAREVGLLSILPAIYAEMLTHRQSEYVLLMSRLQVGFFTPSDRLPFLAGYANLLEQQSRTTFAWLDWRGAFDDSPVPSESCTRPHECLAAVKKVALDLFSTYYPTNIKALALWDQDWGKDLCRVCRKDAKAVFDAGRAECWEELPYTFGFPDWDELKALDFE
ncbi:hypothetical protein C8F04DRAFT_1035489 [Mycena alexandri]|uniref:BTB domain-containing protein n=1 Tax=Mycena alexandri TaxID=1745969 RepID=A0AAD6T275_9AGAR|nr:hypothetical protein C8F04DRAFT_1035489 [Mycena alexandri]